jgi:hypothetical protein
MGNRVKFPQVWLNMLVKAGLMEKVDSEYRIADRILAHGIFREPFNE